MSARRVYRLTVGRHGHVSVRHYLTKRSAERNRDRELAGYYVEARSYEESGYRVDPATSAVIDVSDPLTFPDREPS